MTSVEKFNTACRLLKEVKCPKPIMDALWLFGLTVQDDQARLDQWKNLADPSVVEGECVKVELQPYEPGRTA